MEEQVAVQEKWWRLEEQRPAELQSKNLNRKEEKFKKDRHRSR
jgi:hypothetical protein